MGERAAEAVTLSVLITTYKHEAYIAECLESVIGQQTSFRIEILVGVDDGGDRTLAICREYEAKYPELIKVYLNDSSNVLHVGGVRVGRYNFLNIFSKASGKYVARLDGDDYWTFPGKLQAQVDFLEANSDFVISHHWHEYAHIAPPGGYEIKPAPTVGQGYWPYPVATAKEIFENKMRVKLRTIVFRKVVDEMPPWFHRIKYGDVAMSMILAKHGKIGFINEPWAVYRITHAGASSKGKEDPMFTFNHFTDWVKNWEYGDEYYAGQYRKEAIETILGFYRTILTQYRFDYAMLSKCINYVNTNSILPTHERSYVKRKLYMMFISGRFRRLFGAR